jgi:large subunit ribosomal protein L19
MTLIQEIEKSQMKSKVAQVKVGDTIRVHQRIEEGGKERIQTFEGTVISFKEKNNPRATIRIRRIASGVGVEKTFLLYSPFLEKIEVVRGGKSRRAKLYYMRKMVGKAAQKLEEQERENHVWEKEKTTGITEEEANKANKTDKEEKTDEAKPVTEQGSSAGEEKEEAKVAEEIEHVKELPVEKEAKPKEPEKESK